MNALNGRESVPNTLRPPPSYRPLETRRQRIARFVDEQLRALDGYAHKNGRPLSGRSIEMLGQPCPGGWYSAHGYNDRGCRCEGCRTAMSRARTAYNQRRRAAA